MPFNGIAADVCWITQVGQGQWNRVLDMVSRIRGLGMEVTHLQQLYALPCAYGLPNWLLYCNISVTAH